MGGNFLTNSYNFPANLFFFSSYQTCLDASHDKKQPYFYYGWGDLLVSMSDLILDWKGDASLSQSFLEEAAEKYRNAVLLFPGKKIGTNSE